MGLGAVLLGGAPWLIYLGVEDDTTTSDEQAFGFLSTAGILGGAYLGYRFSRGGDETRDRREPADAQTTALLRRDATGRWSLGPPLPRRVGRRDTGWLVDVVGGKF